MYRIDENTYIDDSLVTCAEYQVFIDEMREQDKYLQPDHWTSYQFQPGQARALILGVRPSDAKFFCEWLTQREVGEWRYRLPTLDQAKEYPLTPSALSPLGYWTEGNTEDTQFAWVGPIPVNPRALVLDIPLPHDLELAHAINFDRALDRVINTDRILESVDDLANETYLDLAIGHASDLASDLALALASASDHDFPRDIALANARNLDRALANASDHDFPRDLAIARAFLNNLDHDLAHARDLDLAQALARDLNRAHAPDLDLARDRDLANALASDLALAQAREIDFAYILVRASDIANAIASVRNIAQTRDIAHVLARDRDLGLAHALASALASTFDLACYYILPIYTDLFTIQERIAGRSPAFEGIRIVKERKP